MLTERQRELYQAIQIWFAGHQIGPSVRDLVRLSSYRSTSVVSHTLGVLENRGLIRRERDASGHCVARGISLPQDDPDEPGDAQEPCRVLAATCIRCGGPVIARIRGSEGFRIECDRCRRRIFYFAQAA